MPACSAPDYNCSLCPRLRQFIKTNRKTFLEFYNGPVPSFGEIDAELLVVGLAPGLKGANRTGRPFTGDYAGLILYFALQKHGFATGEYDPQSVGPEPEGSLFPKRDTFQLANCRITNAVRCVPPENKPDPSEIKECNQFLKSEIQAMSKLKVIITLGQISHKAVIQALGQKQSAYKFIHGAVHEAEGIKLLNSYHTSRYNINTGTLTQAMFNEIIVQAKKITNSTPKKYG